jgi:hypothetical protein
LHCPPIRAIYQSFAARIAAQPATEIATMTTEPTATAPAAFTADDIKRKAYPVTDMTVFAADVAKVTGLPNFPVKFNFDPAGEFPAGFAGAIIPIQKRDENKKENVTVGALIAAIPTFDAIAAAEGGVDFIRATVTNRILAQLATAVRPRDTGNAPSIPLSIADYLTSARADNSLETYTELSKAFVKALREKGLKSLTAALLRQSLRSSAFAQDKFKNIQQSVWVNILDAMEQAALNKGLDPSIFRHWKATRDATAFDEVSEIDTSDLLSAAGL